MLLTHSFNAMAEQKDGPLLAMLTWDSIIRLIAIGLSGQRAGMPGNGNWQFAEILKGEVVAALVKNPILHSSPSIPNKKPILLPNYYYTISNFRILFSFLDDAQEMVRIAQDTSFSLGNIKHIFAKINILLSSRMLGDLRDDPIRDPVIDTIYEGADYPHNEYFVGYNTVFSSAITQFVWGMFNILFGTGMVTFLINKDIVNTVLILPRTWIIIKNLEEDLQAYSNKLSTHFSRLLPFWSKRMQSG
ncbi:hypothetical protein ACJX0J_000246 (mitochondrion) [Zea mays]